MHDLYTILKTITKKIKIQECLTLFQITSKKIKRNSNSNTCLHTEYEEIKLMHFAV